MSVAFHRFNPSVSSLEEEESVKKETMDSSSSLLFLTLPVCSSPQSHPQPKKGKEPQLHKALHKLYLHLDSADNVADDDDVDTGGLSAAGAPGEFYPYVFVPVEWEV